MKSMGFRVFSYTHVLITLKSLLIQYTLHNTSHSTQPNPCIDPTHVHLWRGLH